MNCALTVTVATLLLGTVLSGQSISPVGPSQTLHISGTVFGALGVDVVPGATVSFQSEHANRSIVSDSSGTYEIDLPVGLYKMTAQYRYVVGRNLRIEKFIRPLFRLSSPAGIMLNVPMFAERLNCDIVVVGKSGGPATPEQRELAEKDLCGGEDFFDAPSGDGTPFQLYIRYPKRSPHDPVYDYAGDQLATNAYTPVLVEYNLFTLTAKHVVYDSRNQTVAARGDVAVVDQLGQTHHGTSMLFKLGEGQAIVVR